MLLSYIVPEVFTLEGILIGVGKGQMGQIDELTEKLNVPFFFWIVKSS